jgi:transcriptional regulator with XRE-family HTH domain
MNLVERTRDIDGQIGIRVRAARMRAKLTQVQLAERVGVSFQQVQKYENGRNRIAASTLMLIADAVNATVGELLPKKRAEERRAT